MEDLEIRHAMMDAISGQIDHNRVLRVDSEQPIGQVNAKVWRFIK